jgi:hypothetical protein
MTPLLLLTALSGCTRAPGTGFATLSGVDLRVEHAPGEARDLGDGSFLTDLGYRVRLDDAELDVGSVRFEELRGGAGDFDPADPPEGYSLCHGGHCHAADGSLVAYADVEAELAGDSASFEPVATLAVDRSADLLAGEDARLLSVAPSPELPAATIRRCSVGVGGVRMAGSVGGGGLTEDLALAVDLDLDDTLTGPFDLDVDRDSPPVLELGVDVVVGGTLFDGVDFAGLAVDGAVSLTSATGEGAASLRDAFLAIEPSVTVEDDP